MISFQIRNVLRNVPPRACGDGCRTLILASIGNSLPEHPADTELAKAKAAEEAGADAVTDHSFYGDIGEFHTRLVSALNILVSTVGCYELAARYPGDTFSAASWRTPVDILIEQARRGIDMITVHAALRREHLPLVAASHRLIPMTSKGGGIVSAFMRCKGSENPYYEEFDRLLEAFASYGVTLSLGTSLRPASVCDGYDELSAAELETMAELASRALAAGVNVMIEGLGHATIGRIPEEVRRGKAACHGIPYRVLPMCTDIALGYDHIAGAIAGAVAVGAGADAITCMTRAEHLGLPTVDEVREAVIATRVAAHAGELVKIGDFSRDRQMSRTRWEHGCKGDWTAAVYPEGAREALVARGRLEDQQIRCSMCGNHCGIGGGIDSVGQAAALGARK